MQSRRDTKAIKKFSANCSKRLSFSNGKILSVKAEKLIA